MSTVGIVLNIGTPNSTSTQDVRRYLTQFLSDAEVVNIPAAIRIPLVRFWIAPKRAPFSAEKYKKIWTDEGSPLLIHSLNFARAMERELGHPVLVGMRYGEPSIAKALQQAKQLNATKLLLLPMYPQYARATTASSLNAVKAELAKMNWSVATEALKDFYLAESFLSASLQNLPKEKVAEKFDHVLFSFHGLPVSQIKRDKECSMGSCCDLRDACKTRCYRAQSVATAKALASRLGLNANQYSYSFQSRLGPVEWIRPYTDEVVQDLAKKGVKRLLVLCPSFVADCLETLEEVGMEVRELFLSNGGQEYQLQSCVNASEVWVRTLAAEIKNGSAVEPLSK